MPRPEVLAEFHSTEGHSAEGQSAEGQSAASVFALRAPASATRRDHWRQVLRWYGVEGGRSYPVPAPPADPGRHVLVCLDPALRSAVESYARLLDGLLDSHLEESIMAVARDARQGQRIVCARCGSGCRWVEAADQAGLGVRLRWLPCPACGLPDAICGPATGLGITVPATLAIAPAGLSPGLHTLHFLYASGLGWSVHRRRVAYWPEPKEEK
jgi:hypothetical protein